jgi:acylphosphatase
MSRTISRIEVRGRVQGVGYRAWVEYQASQLGLHGWVRNRRDGSVEAVLAGDGSVVASMIASCHRGPPSARVDAVVEETANLDALGLRRAGEEFSVLPTL